MNECHAPDCTNDADGVDGKCMFHSEDDLATMRRPMPAAWCETVEDILANWEH